MLDINKMIKSAESCLGWPYVSPGTEDENGIDCSGLFVKMYRDQGEDIAHGSNSIFRKYCSSTGKLTSTKQLQPGMAVFKWREWTDSDEDKANRWWNTEPGDLKHIGFVVSAKPLRIIHASTNGMKVREDNKLGQWAYWGKLKKVNYDGGEEVVIRMEYKYVNTASGSLNMRSAALSNAALVTRIPRGEKVAVTETSGAWSKVTYDGKTGWVMSSYLSATEVEGDKIAVSMSRNDAMALYEALKVALKL